MMNSRVLRPLRRMMIPLFMLTLSGCATIEALKLASEGSQLTQKGDYDKAQESFNASLAKANTSDAHAGLGTLYFKQARYGEAVDELEKAIKLSTPLEVAQAQALPAITRNYLVLGQAQLLLNNGPAAFETANRVRGAIEPWVANNPQNKAILKEALLLQVRIIEATDDTPSRALQIVDDQGVQLRFPDDPDMKAEKAVIAALGRKKEEATALADAVLKSRPEEGDALLARAIVQATSGDMASARKTLGNVLTEDRSRAMVTLKAARGMQKDGKNAEAMELLQMLAEVQPSNHLIHMDMAAIAYNLGKTDESIAAYLKVLETYVSLQPYVKAPTPEALTAKLKELPPTEMDRSNLEIFYQNLALLYRTKKDLDSGIKYLERSAAINPSETTVKDIALYYRDKGDMAGAVKTLERLLTMKPDDAQTLKTLGQMTITTNPAKSREYFAKASKLAPTDSDIALGLGVGLFNAKMYKEAVEEFENAVKLMPNNADALYYLALSQSNAGDKKSAEANFLKVVEMKVDYADAYRELGNIARDKKDYKGVEKWYGLEDKYRGKKK